MTKDYLKFRNAIKKDNNLTLEESYMLELIFDYHNISIGYAYPGYDILMADLKTKRKAKVSKLLKSLVKKGYISITKIGKKNTYKLLKYLFINRPVDSDGKPPIDGQIHFTELTEEENKIVELGFTQKQAKSLLQVAKDKVDKIVRAFNYATEKGADNLYSYTLWAINNISKIKNTFKSVEENETEWKPKTKFDNFKPRQYDYDDLEKRLLGWV
ncbi:helix-turn-helix domain-containing protein [Clostridium sp.]|uniref:helix-turn-helix transcriptional regulator n=1 Tax=Clostridium sp. TaxID=1506 RepID=UPI00284134AF|nr:helix-turn-helix domain-containing protein [Clostridium sp.]MDR3595074.1 helix-turn-helix domain-containing protein [Clostridium sp.]